MNVTKKSLEDKQNVLMKENEERVQAVQTYQEQITKLNEAIQTLKEEHDVCRGKLLNIQDLLGEVSEEKSEDVRDK